MGAILVKYVTRAMAVVVLVAGACYAQDSKEIALGQRLYSEFDSRHRMIADVEMFQYIEDILKNLSRNELLRLPLTLKVVDDSEVVASALPGGTVLLSSGAILRAGNEAELAALLAHAMGHVQAGQPVGRASNVNAIPIVFIGGPWGLCARGRVAFMPEQARLLEAQADLLGLGYLTHAGYDPQALVSVFDHGRFRPDDTVKSMAVALTSASTVLNTSTFDQIKRHLTPPPLPRPPVPTLYK
jgi:predicted Zn-dependent protease